jgi:hypothetical protein
VMSVLVLFNGSYVLFMPQKALRSLAMGLADHHKLRLLC